MTDGSLYSGTDAIAAVTLTPRRGAALADELIAAACRR
jgi:hypothetical protein